MEKNNSFDYTDVNVSQRKLKKMINTSLYDNIPYQKEKFIQKLIEVSPSRDLGEVVKDIQSTETTGSMSHYNQNVQLNRQKIKDAMQQRKQSISALEVNEKCGLEANPISGLS